jgi:hypothetical protein
MSENYSFLTAAISMRGLSVCAAKNSRFGRVF